MVVRVTYDMAVTYDMTVIIFDTVDVQKPKCNVHSGDRGPIKSNDLTFFSGFH